MKRAHRARQAPAPFGVALPDSVEVEARRLRVADTLHHTVAVTGYPHDVRLGWLEPLVTHPGPADISLHIEPIPAPVAAERLRRQLARLESSRRLDASKGRLADPALDASAGDARDLADRLARGEGRLFHVGLYATCRGADQDDLERETGRLRAVLASLLLDTVPATYRSLPGWFTTLPVGLDLLRLRRTMDTAALAAAFPFASAELSDPAGVLWGRNTRTGGLVFWDRFAQPNYNAVILARSGAGKSYLAKLELLRSLYTGVEAAVIDPEDEYARLTHAVGGAYIHLGAPGVRLNPFDLDDQPDALTRRALFLHTLVAVLLGETPDPAARAALDTAIVAAYQHCGITADARTHRRPPPTLADLADSLTAAGDAAGATLAARLAPFVTGTHRHLFDGPTKTSPEGHLVTFSLRDLPDELKAAGTLLVLDAVWRRVTDPARRRPRIVVVDEAWLVMRDPAGGRFLHRLAKSARKHWCGLTVVTQDAADLLASDLGQAVVANAYPAESPLEVLHGVNLAIHEGELVAIVGPSGSGKSTLLNLMGTLDRPTTGTVRVTGIDIAHLSDRQLSALRAGRIGFVFQQFFLSEHQTVLDNVADGLLYAGKSLRDRQRRAVEALSRVGLAHRMGHRPTQISGGERQRVAIARALVGRPAIVLADEPTGNLDSASGAAIIGMLEQLNRDGATIVVITHDRDLAARLPRRVEVLDGRIVADSHPAFALEGEPG